MALLMVAACGGDTPMGPSVNVPFSTTDLVPGTGAVATPGNLITVNYTGWLYDPNVGDNKGHQFDSSLNPGRTPYSFVLGVGTITGFSQGIVGMSVGGTRRIIIPPNLGYGSAPYGDIPGNSTLIFEVTLISIP